MNIFMRDNMCTIYKLVFHKMHLFLQQNGHCIVDTPQEADSSIAGVCAAFEADENRSVELIEELASNRRPLYIWGCLTQVAPAKIRCFQAYPAWSPESLLERLSPTPRINWDQIDLPSSFRTRRDWRVYNPSRRFVGISTGCSFNCSYCPHKIGTGDLVSRAPSDILKQIRHLSDTEVSSVVLTATDTAAYGKDIGYSFPRLLEDVLITASTNTAFHIAQFNPEGLFLDLPILSACCSDHRVRDMQLPIQTTSPKLLKIMNRYYSMEEIRNFIIDTKKSNPFIVFRTDLMVGFPTETAQELDDSIDFVIDLFDEVAVYAFEYKSCTPLATYDLPLHNKSEILHRQRYAVKRVESAGKLVHSGGQDTESLLISDKHKAAQRDNVRRTKEL